jgi:hypothetical protein
MSFATCSKVSCEDDADKVTGGSSDPCEDEQPSKRVAGDENPGFPREEQPAQGGC